MIIPYVKKKTKIWKITENGALFVRKADIMLMTSSKQRNIYYVDITFEFEPIDVLNISAKFQ